MPEAVTFKCLRCGHEWRGIYDPDVERMCPQCRSNSIRRMKETGKHAQVDKETRASGQEEAK